MARSVALPEPGSGPPGLTLVGVGPGDPELLTLAGLRALAAAATVAFPVAAQPTAAAVRDMGMTSATGSGMAGATGSGMTVAAGSGMAVAIVEEWLDPRQRRLPLPLPMGQGAEPQRRAWHGAADQLAAAVAAGQAVVLLCEGDVSLFASASYLLLALRQRHPRCPVTLVPGITAVAAAAAVGAWPLALQRESLLIRPCPETPAALEALLEAATAGGQVLALLKLGARWLWLRPLLERRGLLEQCLFAQRVGWPDQRVLPAAAAPHEEAPYFSLLLIRLGWPELMP
mgnify:CR=1 FL=1